MGNGTGLARSVGVTGSFSSKIGEIRVGDFASSQRPT